MALCPSIGLRLSAWGVPSLFLLALASCTAAPHKDVQQTNERPKALDKAPDIYLAERLELPFLADGWAAFTGWEGQPQVPLEAISRFYIRRGEQTLRIDQPSDFAKHGAVRIKSVNDALAFLQLFTGEETFFLFPEVNAIDIVRWSEEMDKDQPESEAEELAEYGISPAEAHVACLSPEAYDRLKLAPPVVHEEPNRFVCRRFIVRCARVGDVYELAEQREAVSKDGAYGLLSSTLVGTIPVDEIVIPEGFE